MTEFQEKKIVHGVSRLSSKEALPPTMGSESSSTQQIKKCPAVESKVPIQAVILAAAAPPPPPAAGRTH